MKSARLGDGRGHTGSARGLVYLAGTRDTIRLATSDFMFGGGDGYEARAAGTNVHQPGDRLLDIAVAEVAAQSTPPNPGVSAVVQDRIVRQ